MALNENRPDPDQLLAQISTLQQSAQDTLLRKASVVSDSRVIDPAATSPAWAWSSRSPTWGPPWSISMTGSA